MGPKKRLAEVRRELVPWLRSWDALGVDDGEPPPPDPELVRRLQAITTEHPTYEPALRELLTVHLLLDHRLGAIAVLRRILELPPGKPKQRALDRDQLRGLLESDGAEKDEFLVRAGLTQEQFVSLGRFLEDRADGGAAMNGFANCRDWLRDNGAADAAAVDAACERLDAAGAFNDASALEAWFEFSAD